MKNSPLHAMAAQLAARNVSPFSQTGLTRLVDEMIESYVSWREECFAVDASYENWGRAERHDRALAYTAYQAALDREEHAAGIYQDLAERVALP